VVVQVRVLAVAEVELQVIVETEEMGVIVTLAVLQVQGVAQEEEDLEAHILFIVNLFVVDLEDIIQFKDLLVAVAVEQACMAKDQVDQEVLILVLEAVEVPEVAEDVQVVTVTEIIYLVDAVVRAVVMAVQTEVLQIKGILHLIMEALELCGQVLLARSHQPVLVHRNK
jgi:hypothetical protein